MLLNMLLIVVSLGQVWDTTGVIEDPGIHVVELPIVSINIADVVEPYGPRGQNEDASPAKPGSKGKVASQRRCYGSVDP